MSDNPFAIDADLERIVREMEERASAASMARVQELVAEQAARSVEALRLYEPSEYQESFHSCRAKQAVLLGGTQVGKSLCAFAEVARAVTGQDPYSKYPKRNGRALCLGYKETHIGLVIYRYLFQPGAFKIVRDPATGKMRTWRPWAAEDAALADKLEDAPPLIPPRFVKRMVWHKAGQRIFSKVEFTTGWELLAFSSLGEPVQGIQLDLVHIDEDIERQDWHAEMISRLTMRNGLLRWSALPQSRNEALVNLVEMADEDADKPEPERHAFAVRATIFDNKYISERARIENVRAWRAEGEEVYRKRALGQMTTDTSMVYPTFSKYIHDAMRPEHNMSAARAMFIERRGEPPADWMRVAAVDPGHQVCAVLLMAVPPPSLGVERFIYDEIYIVQSEARLFAAAMRRKTDGHTFQRFIIDAHGGAHSSAETGIPVRQAYSRELEVQGVRCVDTGSGFVSGVDNILAREQQLRRWLGIREDTREPTVFIHVASCPNLCREISRFKKKVVNGVTQDEANRRLPCHAIEALEYLASDGREYKRPQQATVAETSVQRILRGIREREARRQSQRAWTQGNTISLGPME